MKQKRKSKVVKKIKEKPTKKTFKKPVKKKKHSSKKPVKKKKVTKKIKKPVQKKVTKPVIKKPIHKKIIKPAEKKAASFKNIEKPAEKKSLEEKPVLQKTSAQKTPLIMRKKPIEKIKRIPTGISGLDHLAGGGFEENSVNLIVGGTGTAKTIFALQFLIQGLKKGENCLYITFQEKREEFFKNMLELGWNLEDYERRGKFVFLEYTPEKIRVMLEEGGGEIESIVFDKGVKRLVIDSVTSFALLFDEELTKREAALSLFGVIRKWNCTSLITLQEEHQIEEGGSVSIEFESDSIILLYFIRKGEQRQRYLEILKMRGTKHSTQIHPFHIAKNGIAVGRGVSKNHVYKSNKTKVKKIKDKKKERSKKKIKKVKSGKNKKAGSKRKVKSGKSKKSGSKRKVKSGKKSKRKKK